MGEQAGSPRQEHYSLFDTPIGPCGVAWSVSGLTRLQLPESDPSTTEERIRARSTNLRAEGPPSSIRDVIASLRRYLRGDRIDFSSVSIDLTGVSPFHRKVYDAARSVGWGHTASYGELARQAGSPAAARAVGQALSRNPIAIIVPCHRILASGNKVGGFSAFGGTCIKEHLLALEGIHLGAPALGNGVRYGEKTVM
jgi:methylated-DNA-[protein]-cysteine S-methyltransferase